jgi:signal transduction histidine kinase
MFSGALERGARVALDRLLLGPGALIVFAIVSALALAISVYALLASAERDKSLTEQRVFRLHQELGRELRTGGETALREEIRAFEDAGEIRIGLRSPDQIVLVDHAPVSPRRLGWMTYERRGDRGEPHRSLAYVGLLQDGSTLSVATDLPGHADGVPLTGATASALLLLAIVGYWLFSAARTERELRNVAETMARVGRGELSLRLPLPRQLGPLRTLCALGNDLLENIERRDHSIREAMKAVAHELRTPLSHAISRAELLTAAELAPEEGAAALQRLRSDLQGLAASFEALLRLARIEQTRTSDMTVDLALKVGNVLDAYSAALDDHGAVVSLACQSANVHMDRDLAYLLISAVLDNVFKHTPRGVRVELRTWREGPHCYFLYSDDGPGVAAAERSRITERFFRGSTTRADGLGLGLTTVEAIVQSAKGDLHVEDAGPGLRLRARFPAVAPLEPRPAPALAGTA